jgi:hypothetical protein
LLESCGTSVDDVDVVNRARLTSLLPGQIDVSKAENLASVRCLEKSTAIQRVDTC